MTWNGRRHANRQTWMVRGYVLFFYVCTLTALRHVCHRQNSEAGQGEENNARQLRHKLAGAYRTTRTDNPKTRTVTHGALTFVATAAN
jgi:hypothetical protein